MTKKREQEKAKRAKYISELDKANSMNLNNNNINNHDSYSTEKKPVEKKNNREKYASNNNNSNSITLKTPSGAAPATPLSNDDGPEGWVSRNKKTDTQTKSVTNDGKKTTTTTVTTTMTYKFKDGSTETSETVETKVQTVSV